MARGSGSGCEGASAAGASIARGSATGSCTPLVCCSGSGSDSGAEGASTSSATTTGPGTSATSADVSIAGKGTTGAGVARDGGMTGSWTTTASTDSASSLGSSSTVSSFKNRKMSLRTKYPFGCSARKKVWTNFRHGSPLFDISPMTWMIIPPLAEDCASTE